MFMISIQALLKKIAKKYRCEVAKTAKEAISSDKINAILIASATPTHTDYIALGAESKKAILLSLIHI